MFDEKRIFFKYTRKKGKTKSLVMIGFLYIYRHCKKKKNTSENKLKKNLYIKSLLRYFSK